MTKTMSEQPILALMIEPADRPPGRMSTWGPDKQRYLLRKGGSL